MPDIFTVLEKPAARSLRKSAMVTIAQILFKA
jgi:hypothetical protein